MNKNTFLGVSILISSVIIGFANAQTTISETTQIQPPSPLEQIQYPILELGNCKNKEDCKVFCNDPKNSNACFAFAEQNDLMSSDQVTVAKKFADNGLVGPGGCRGQAMCEQYCSNSIHLEECTVFAQKNGMMSNQQVQDSEKVIAAIKNGLKPPACAGPEQCNTYCSSPDHMAECMTFSLAAGIVPADQKAQMQKTLDVLKQGIKPPACQPKPPDQSKQSSANQSSQSSLPACDTYCSDSSHMAECMTFSLATGMVPADQKAQMQKTLDVLKQGIKPPACQPKPPDQSGQPGRTDQINQGGSNEGQDFNPGSGVNGNGSGFKQSSSGQLGQGLQACDTYCADPSHVEECVKFSVAIGNMTEEQGQNSIKNGNKGPGECIGKDACDTFCNNPDNQEACLNFAKDNGMISEKDLQRIQQGQPGQGGSMKPGQNQPGQGTNQQIQPWADMCQPDESGNPTVLACVDGDGKFIASAKVGSDGKPVCPTDSTAKCGNYKQENQQNGKDQQNQQGGPQGNPNQPGQGGPNQGQQNQQDQPGDKFKPGSETINPGGQQMPQQAGPGGCKGPEECQRYCASNPEACKNFQPQQNGLGQPNQPGQQQEQNQPGQRLPQQQPGQLNQGGTNNGTGPCGTGPGTCSGIGPDDVNPQSVQSQFNQLNQPNQFNQINQPNQSEQQSGQQNQPEQMPPQQQLQPQSQPPIQQQNPPSSPSSFLQGMNNFFGSVLTAFLK